LVVEEPGIAIPDQFERVFRTHHGLVFRTAYRITGNAADAEDVLQTVFLRLFRRAGETTAHVATGASPVPPMRSEAGPLQLPQRSKAEPPIQILQEGRTENPSQSGVLNEEAYLRRAAVNAALDIIRSRQSDRTVEFIDLPGRHSHGDTAELRDALARAMGKLQPRWAQVFALRFLEGLSNREIAQTLGISQVLVAVIVYRSRQQLRKELSSFLGKGIQESRHE